MSIRPILFNTEMVQAILDDRKTVTRRVVKKKYENTDLEMFTDKHGTRLVERQNDAPPDEEIIMPDGRKGTRCHLVAMREVPEPYHPGDVLWVRETWRMQNYGFDYDTRTYQGQELQYRADLTDGEDECYGRRGGCAPCRWSPSIHMPREAARLFLRVKSVWVERLREITPESCEKEGLTETQKSVLNKDEYWYWFMNLWNSTIKPADLPRYGWDANPFVWAIEFERCDRPEGFA